MAKRILAGCLAAVILTGLGWYAGFLHSESQAGREQEKLWQQIESLGERIAAQEELQAEKQADSVQKAEVSANPDSVVKESDLREYELVEENGRVTIYRVEGRTLFEDTGIMVNSLPEELQAEISHGKRICSEKELYDFLENYSS